MKFGIYLPNYGAKISVQNLAELTRIAEETGWDGFFIWDHILVSKTLDVPMVDPWVALTAMAVATDRIRIGTTVTPIARRRPWKLARETVSLDHLSNGRLTLTVGLGEPPEAEFAHFGENPNARVRAQKLDEGLEILTGLWRGKPFNFEGHYYQIKETTFLPPALQKPRIPFWVGGFWPNKPPFRRAARWDGAFPLMVRRAMTPEDVSEILTFIDKHRKGGQAFDIVLSGTTLTKSKIKQKEIITSFAEVGTSWWLESMYSIRNSHENVMTRIKQGPPNV